MARYKSVNDLYNQEMRLYEYSRRARTPESKARAVRASRQAERYQENIQNSSQYKQQNGMRMRMLENHGFDRRSGVWRQGSMPHNAYVINRSMIEAQNDLKYPRSTYMGGGGASKGAVAG